MNMNDIIEILKPSSPTWDGQYPSIGKKIVKDFSRPSPELVKKFENFFVPALVDFIGVLYTMDGSLRPAYSPMPQLLGTAFTVKVPPGDNLMVKKALHMAKPGDVIVVDARGQTNWCCGGGGMTVVAKQRGVKGMVIDGAYRDIREIKEIEFPMFLKGVAPTTGPKRGPGEINVPVCCGGVVVHPGDIIVGDEVEGVVVIPKQYAELIAGLVEGKADFKKASEWDWNGIVQRDTHRDKYFDEVLKARGFEFVDYEE
jgi:4-hydroxy-4-methyl-2-oxoglutarate aldolase